MKINKKVLKFLKKDNRIIYCNDNKYKFKCDCGKTLKENDNYYYYFVDMNYFDWWAYELKDNSKLDFKRFNTKVIVKFKPFGYIGYVPLLNDFVYYCHKFFHKKQEILIIECDECNGEKENV